MNLSNQTIILLVIIAILILLSFFFLYKYYSPITNDGTVNLDYSNYNSDSNIAYNEQTNDDENDECFMKKIKNKHNGNKRHKYECKQASTQEFDNFFKESNEIFNNQACPQFQEYEADEQKYAKYNGSKQIKKKQTVEEIFDPSNLLPKDCEKNDWFDPVPEPISVKDKHLINIHRAVGTNTKNTRGQTHDIRGDIPNPKIDNITPWNNTTKEPCMYNNKSFM